MSVLGRLIAVCCSAWLGVFAECTPASALDKDIIDAVKDAVMALCQSPNGDGKYVSVAGAGDAGVSVQILKFVGAADAKGKLSFTTEEWSGIRKVADQASDNKDYRACVRDLSPKFLDKLGETTKEKQSNANNSVEVPRGVVAVKYDKLKNAEFESTYWASWSDKVRIAKSGEKKVIATLDCPRGSIEGMDISRGVAVVACSSDLRLMKIPDGEIFTFSLGPPKSGQTSELLELGLSYTVSKHSSDPCLIVWNSIALTNNANPKPLYRLACSASVKSIALHDKYPLLAIGFSDGTIEVWSLNANEAAKLFSQKFVRKFEHPFQNNGIWGVEFTGIEYGGQGFKLAAHTWGNIAYVIDLPNYVDPPVVTTIEYPVSDHVIFTSRLSSNGKNLALGTSDGAVTVWDSSTHKLLGKHLHDDSVQNVDFGSNNDIVLSVSLDKTVKSFRTSTSAVVDTLNLRKGSIALRVNLGRRRFVVGEGTRAPEEGTFYVGEWLLNPGGKISSATDR